MDLYDTGATCFFSVMKPPASKGVTPPCKERCLLPVIIVSPPINLFPLNFEFLRKRVDLIICGDRDPYCPLDEARNAAVQTSCLLETIPDADHFLIGREADLAACIDSFVMRLLRSKKSSQYDKKYLQFENFDATETQPHVILFDVLSYRISERELELLNRNKFGILFLQAKATTGSGSDPEKGWLFL